MGRLAAGAGGPGDGGGGASAGGARGAMGGGFSTGGGGGGSGGGGHVLSSRRLSPAMEAAGALVLAFNPATQAKLAKALAAVARAEGIDVAPARLAEIAAASQGDVRCAIGTLQLMASGRTSNLAAAAASAGRGRNDARRRTGTRPATAWGPSPPPRMRESVDATRVSPCSTPWGRSCTTNATPGLPQRTRERTAPRTASLPSPRRASPERGVRVGVRTCWSARGHLRGVAVRFRSRSGWHDAFRGWRAAVCDARPIRPGTDVVRP